MIVILFLWLSLFSYGLSVMPSDYSFQLLVLINRLDWWSVFTNISVVGLKLFTMIVTICRIIYGSLCTWLVLLRGIIPYTVSVLPLRGSCFTVLRMTSMLNRSCQLVHQLLSFRFLLQERLLVKAWL